MNWLLLILLISEGVTAANAGAAPLPTRQGYVIGWGVNVGGDGPDLFRTGIVVVANQVVTNAISLAAGGVHALALRSDGTVIGWGANRAGEALGFTVAGTQVATGEVKVAGSPVKDIAAVAAGTTITESFSLALTRAGKVIGWGDNRVGQTTIPEGLTDVVAIATGGAHALALKRDGTVVGWGQTHPLPTELTNVVAIAAGRKDYSHDLALKSDGTVTEWSLMGVRREVGVPSMVTNVTAIASGSSHRLALRRDGTVVGWGDDSHGEATGVTNTNFPPSSTGTVTIAGQTLSNVVAIAAGADYSLALRDNGTVVAWGYPTVTGGKFGVPEGLSNVIAIAAAEDFCLAITTNRAVAERFQAK